MLAVEGAKAAVLVVYLKSNPPVYRLRLCFLQALTVFINFHFMMKLFLSSEFNKKL